ncbi:uncharacterized protein MELLADRAFT_118690 [Melampsora larici-populina 98AG31]|uniref:Stress response protein NST1 n=1 Tax=Melampsora larici-populina (strain 98AG31 / pathotype 3-4-7) TaxID=747676 RepID=F4SD88_MELLP|nr:uncharacterized protein MELLADRAFT_118690 [Melampsora larici-populina 98AG31]EGF97390.1 hypothetical protein MELLADRAFT_118690 [Melampsora larici-populina 98AG31]
MPKSKTSNAAKKKNKKKAAQARQFDSNQNHLSIDHQDPGSLADRSDMIGAYPNEDASSHTQRTTTGSVSQDDDDERLTTHAMHPSLAAATRQTQEDLLATANDLYRQIETAAAAALASHLSPQSLANIGNNNSPASGGIHGGGSGHSNQMSTAAQQAGLTHSNSMNHILNGNTRPSHNFGRDINGGAATVSVTGGTVTGTIPLGSFTLPLPLHSHPDHSHHHSHSVNVSEPVYYTGETTIVTSRMGDKSNGDEGVLDDEYYSDDGRISRNDMSLNNNAAGCRHNLSEQTSNDSNMGINHSSLPAPSTGTKKKKKNKKKKSANASSNEAAPNPEPVPNVSHHRTSVPSIPHPSKNSTQPPGRNPCSEPPNHMANQPPISRLPPMPNNGVSKKKASGLPATTGVRDNHKPATSNVIPNHNPSHPPTERERIRDFWLTLNQEERANLVKIEKDAVLKKMKEQQRHSCSCAVCGRKRLAIEQELEVLYDAYYDELENYAEASKKYYGSDLKMKGVKSPVGYPKPPGPGPFPGSVDVMTTNVQPTNNQSSLKKAVPKPTRDHKNIRPRPLPNSHQTHPPIQSVNSNSPYPQQPPGKRTIPLPPQPKKALSHNSNSDQDHTHSPSCPHHPHHHGPNHYHHHPNTNTHGKAVSNHNPSLSCHQRSQHHVEDDMFPDDDGDEEEEEDEYDEEDEDEYEEEEEEDQEFEDDDEIPALEEVPSEVPNPGTKKPQMNGNLSSYNPKVTNGDKPNTTNNNSDLFGFGNSLTLDDDDGFDDEIVTEEYRMKEGRRMFQIFAARMFEQRVLTAYREKVAQEKQAQLLRELEDEDRLAQERELKKVKDAQKKKEKKKAQKQQKDQDLAKKLKDKEQEELAAKAAEEAKLEAERRKQEETRLKREAQRKVQEAERAKKEEEKRKRIEEEARKRREKEERQRLEKEARAAKEREEREKKVKEEQERKMKVEADRKEKEAREARAKEEAERLRQAELDRKEAEEIAKREAIKTAAAKLAAQNKNAAAIAAAHQKAQPRPVVSLRSTPAKQTAPPPKVSPVPPAQPLTPVPPFPNHTPSRPIAPPPTSMMPRQMSVGIGLGRPASAAAAPPFSAAIPSMPSFNNVPPRPPSAQYGASTFPLHNTCGPSNLQNLPLEMHPALNNNVPHSAFLPMANFQPPPPMSPMMQPNVGRVFSGPALTTSAAQPQLQMPHRPSVISSLPPSTPTHPSGFMSPSLASATSPLSALHLGSEPVRKASASAIGPIGPSLLHNRRKSVVDDNFTHAGLFNSIEPIGRSRMNGSMHTMGPISGNSDQDSNSISTGTSPRSPSNVLGSSALLADEDDDLDSDSTHRQGIPSNPPPVNPIAISPAKPTSFFSPASLDGGLGVGSSIWGATPSSITGAGWGSSMLSNQTPPHVPCTPLQSHLPSIPPIIPSSVGNRSASIKESTSDWIRRRAISAYCNMGLDEKWIPVGDISIEMQRIHADTMNVGLKDMVDACLIKRNLQNGGGDWQFSQQGTVLFARWLPSAGQETNVHCNGLNNVNG